ncbi:hypothetical protein K491DRAFT_691783 [Lophiostoma macrostomum CBS 122681]|uniref:Uncharacterized protein n=1 Tax=Lophiostoma macrostomum CBS 122681 TaxID=1314788 RepID=A0A6A6TBR4_9PLEO|nr:hypothetical protein K491DRAFT_691783 [Lophiostoma macrostomum CBS 122681]
MPRHGNPVLTCLILAPVPYPQPALVLLCTHMDISSCIILQFIVHSKFDTPKPRESSRHVHLKTSRYSRNLRQTKRDKIAR